MSTVARRAQALMDQVRRRFVELSEMGLGELSAVGAGLPAELASLAELVARAQGLTSSEDPLSGTYRQEIANLRTRLGARGEQPECPVAPAHGAAWLVELAANRVAVTSKRYVAAVRAWHRASRLPAPTDSDEVREVQQQVGI